MQFHNQHQRVGDKEERDQMRAGGEARPWSTRGFHSMLWVMGSHGRVGRDMLRGATLTDHVDSFDDALARGWEWVQAWGSAGRAVGVHWVRSGRDEDGLSHGTERECYGQHLFRKNKDVEEVGFVDCLHVRSEEEGESRAPRFPAQWSSLRQETLGEEGIDFWRKKMNEFSFGFGEFVGSM